MNRDRGALNPLIPKSHKQGMIWSSIPVPMGQRNNPTFPKLASSDIPKAEHLRWQATDESTVDRHLLHGTSFRAVEGNRAIPTVPFRPLMWQTTPTISSNHCQLPGSFVASRAHGTTGSMVQMNILFYFIS